MKIYLIGYAGCGKSTAGKKLAKRLELKFQDLDELIAHSEGKTISEIFEKEGESGFRKLERNYLLKTKELENVVIACGGGTPIAFDNMAWMNEHGFTVYFEMAPGVLYHRIVHSEEVRPRYKGMNHVDMMEKIVDDMMSRGPVYREAKLKVKALDLDLEALAVRVKKEIAV